MRFKEHLFIDNNVYTFEKIIHENGYPLYKSKKSSKCPYSIDIYGYMLIWPCYQLLANGMIFFFLSVFTLTIFTEK